MKFIVLIQSRQCCLWISLAITTWAHLHSAVSWTDSVQNIVALRATRTLPLAVKKNWGEQNSLKIRYGIYCCHFWYKYQWALDQFIIFLLSLQKCQAVLYYMLIDKQMLDRVFCSNIVPSLSSFMSPGKEHLAPENSGARCRHLEPGTIPKPGGISLERAFKMLFRNAFQ